MPETVTEIGNSAFAGCFSLYLDHLPAELKSVGAEAFQYIGMLRNLGLSADISYASNAFSYVNCIQRLYISSDIRLSDYMFYGCGNLVYVCLTDSIENYKLPEGLFYGCRKLRRFDWH